MKLSLLELVPDESMLSKKLKVLEAKVESLKHSGSFEKTAPKYLKALKNLCIFYVKHGLIHHPEFQERYKHIDNEMKQTANAYIHMLTHVYLK